ncbi:MAG: hypothetical protein K2X03_07295 [Bryobacteraceae bacterium]|nr:hypothetical protein [Bryobacteraceae bacterium]
MERYTPLEILNPATLVLAADPRLEPGAEGTLEMWIDAAATQDAANKGAAGKELCILQAGEGDSLNYRVAIRPNGSGLVLYRGSSSSGVSVSMPVLGAGAIHLAFVTAGSGTAVIVNGSAGGSDALGVPTSITQFQYLPPIPQGRRLHFGCDGSGPTAHVWLRSVRLWSRALSQDELNWAKTSSGFPDGRPEISAHLAAYSVFTDQRTEMRFTTPEIRFMEFSAVPGEPFFLRRPPTQQLAAIYVPKAPTASGPSGFRDLKLEFDQASRSLGLTGDPKGSYTLPTVARIQRPATNWLRAAFLRDLLEPLERRRDDTRSLELYTKALVQERRASRSELLGFSDDQDGVATVAGHSTLRLWITRGDRFRRVTGVSNGQFITSLRFESTEGATAGNNGELIESNILKGNQTFSLPLPAGAQFEGFAGTTSNGQLTSLALAYSYPEGTPGDLLTPESTRGLWVDRDDKPPTRLPDTEPAYPGGPRAIRGNYSDQRGYRVQYDKPRDLITITTVEPNKKVAAQTFLFRHTTGERFSNNNAQRQRELWVLPDGKLYWLGADSLTERTLIPSPEYEQPTQDKLPWGATFSLEQRPPMVEANFKGYNPFFMRARDFQATTGADKMLFAMPAEESRDYTTTGSHIIVPYGLHFRRDSRGFEQDSTFVYKTADERQFGWNINLGASVGIPEVFSFSEDGEYQTSQEGMASSSSSTTMTRSVATHYALVLDVAKMKLAPEFEERVFAMRDRYLMNLPRDWKSLFLAFGTHYPYAVTYGGMAWLESWTEKMDVNSKTSEEAKISAEAKGTFEGLFQVGGKAGGGFKRSSSTGGGTESTVTAFGTNGGSFSRGGGWSLGRGEEVPILLDLRPVHQLLSPAFFEDSLIWGALRTEAIKAYDNLLREMAKGTANRVKWDSVRIDPDNWTSGN